MSDKYKYRVIIAGGRKFDNYTLLKSSVSSILSEIDYNDCIVVSGKARGADALGERFAKDNGLPIKEFYAEWNVNGKRAGILRNERMAQYASSDNSVGILIAFWNGHSSGTQNMITQARLYNLAVHIVRYEEPKKNIICF